MQQDVDKVGGDADYRAVDERPGEDCGVNSVDAAFIPVEEGGVAAQEERIARAEEKEGVADCSAGGHEGILSV